jgi:hypothetical protein
MEKYIENPGKIPNFPDRVYKIGKDKLRINNANVLFLDNIIDLPAHWKIKLMELTEEQMLEYIEESRKKDNKCLLQLLQEKWYWRETGDPAIITADMINVDGLSPEQILKRCKSKRPLTLKKIRQVIDFYVGDRSEIYKKDDEGNSLYKCLEGGAEHIRRSQ